ncbi:hypothetical protein [Candidatus Palauibacter polyketidifaciens]|uniref:hypothetical protein n=1 Tax=Candidatus Palauibacter polyketidifaciens TaxID=3056740 RepID=UPI00238EEE81|nr:hypothetical protein [Candidatus Palauibacter polyketidifaciens]MDE2720857.1 hypothetical protein [Candidatus Palauibacter polyketidifaciens]
MIIGCRSRFIEDRIVLIKDIGRRLPLIPVILVTDRDISVPRLLRGVNIFSLVWFDDVQTQLQSQVEEARHTVALSRLSETVRRSGLPPALRAGLVHSFQRARSMPVRNVAELAQAVRRSPITISQQFRIHAGGVTTLSSFIGGLVLLRALQLRLAGSTWTKVSEHLGLARATLNRRSRAWLGCTLTELERIAPEHLLASFVSKYLRPLLEETVSEAVAKRPPTD